MPNLLYRPGDEIKVRYANPEGKDEWVKEMIIKVDADAPIPFLLTSGYSAPIMLDADGHNPLIAPPF